MVGSGGRIDNRASSSSDTLGSSPKPRWTQRPCLEGCRSTATRMRGRCIGVKEVEEKKSESCQIILCCLGLELGGFARNMCDGAADEWPWPVLRFLW